MSLEVFERRSGSLEVDLSMVSCLRAPGRTCRRHERERGEDRRGQAKLPFEVHYPLLSPWGETDHISPDS